MSLAPGSALAIADAVCRGRRRPSDVVGEALARIAARDPAINAIVTVDPGDSLRQAAAVERRLAAGERPTLAGVPVVVKDAVWVAGWRVTQGSRLFADFIAPRDNVAVARLRAAGAVVVGMANMSEFGCKGVTSNLLHGTTRHPLDRDLTPGGSSGGCASALGADLVPLALGTDGGGSARRPAAHAGVVGFKPSGGILANGPGFPGGGSLTAVLAPMARSVADVAALFAALLGVDPADPLSVTLPDARGAGPPRIAFAARLGLDVAVDRDVAAAVAGAAARLAEAGHTVVEAEPDWPDGASERALMPLQWDGLARLHGDAWRRDPGSFDPYIADQIGRGLAQPAADVAAARAVAAAVARAADLFFARHDLVVGPTTPCVAWRHERLGPAEIDGHPVDDRAHAAFTPFFNHALASAISIPCGVDRRGLPIGLQIAGPRFADRRVLALAGDAERLLAA